MESTTSRLKVIVDSREPESILHKIEDRHVQVERTTLVTGDYILSSECAVERKTVHDFMQSVFNGRLFEQAVALKEAYPNPLIVLEGDVASQLEQRSNPRVFWGALLRLELDLGLGVLPTPSPEHTADALCTLAKRLQEGRNKEVMPRHKPRLMTEGDWQVYVVSGLPGIGGKLAKRLLAHFGSVRCVFHADEVSLADVQSIGKVKAARIRRLLESTYSA